MYSYCGKLAGSKFPAKIANRVDEMMSRGELETLELGYLNEGKNQALWQMTHKQCPAQYVEANYCFVKPLISTSAAGQAGSVVHKLVWRRYDCKTELPIMDEDTPVAIREHLRWDDFYSAVVAHDPRFFMQPGSAGNA